MPGHDVEAPLGAVGGRGERVDGRDLERGARCHRRPPGRWPSATGPVRWAVEGAPQVKVKGKWNSSGGSCPPPGPTRRLRRTKGPEDPHRGPGGGRAGHHTLLRGAGRPPRPVAMSRSRRSVVRRGRGIHGRPNGPSGQPRIRRRRSLPQSDQTSGERGPAGRAGRVERWTTAPSWRSCTVRCERSAPPSTNSKIGVPRVRNPANTGATWPPTPPPSPSCTRPGWR